MRTYAAQSFIAAVAFSGGLFVATTATSVQSQTQPGESGEVPIARGTCSTHGALWAITPASFLNMHGASVDPDGNLYTAEVGNGRVQKFRPRPGARPDLLVGKPPAARR